MISNTLARTAHYEELVIRREQLRAEGRRLLLEDERNVIAARRLYDEADRVQRQIDREDK